MPHIKDRGSIPNPGSELRYARVVLAIVLVSCSVPKPAVPTFHALTRDLIYGSLALAPVAATGAGYHQHNGRSLDELIDDYSADGLNEQRRFYANFQKRFSDLDAAALDKEQKADVEIVKSNLALALLELDTIQSYKHNPTIYVELAGNADFRPYVLNYAPQDKRFQQITRRLEKMPRLVEQATANLVDATEVWNRVAREENQGNIDLIDIMLRAECPDGVKADYTRAADQALAALRAFNVFLRD